jgi:hypothetical protein
MTFTAKRRKKMLWASLAVVPLLILFGLGFVFPLANLFSGVESLVLERQPIQAELIGDYRYSATWGTATLHLNPDGTFTEMVIDKAASPKRFEGLWSSRGVENSIQVDFRPWGMVWDEDHGREINLFGMNFYKPRWGKTYAKVNDDLDEQFERQ